MIIIWTAAAFLSGSLMFSYWLGLLANRNLKTVGDGNPGALNLWKAAGAAYGSAGIVLDFLKGFLPVFWFIQAADVSNYGIVLPAVAAILGHAFSPFMGGRGGKAIAVTFGVWSALTNFAASLMYAIILAVLLIISRLFAVGKRAGSDADGFQVVLGMLLLGVCLCAASYSRSILLCWLASFGILAYTHRRELQRMLGRQWNRTRSR